MICRIPNTPNNGYAEFIKFEKPIFEHITPPTHIAIAVKVRLFCILFKKLFPNDTDVVNIDRVIITPYIICMIFDIFVTTYAIGISIWFIFSPTFDNVNPKVIVIIPANIEIFFICFLFSKYCFKVIKPGINNMLLYPAYRKLLIIHPIFLCF